MSCACAHTALATYSRTTGAHEPCSHLRADVHWRHPPPDRRRQTLHRWAVFGTTSCARCSRRCHCRAGAGGAESFWPGDGHWAGRAIFCVYGLGTSLPQTPDPGGGQTSLGAPWLRDWVSPSHTTPPGLGEGFVATRALRGRATQSRGAPLVQSCAEAVATWADETCYRLRRPAHLIQAPWVG